MSWFGLHVCLLLFIALFIAQVNSSDIIWRSQTRLTSSMRLPCSQQHYPCRLYDVKFCSSAKSLYLGAAAWDDAAHVWSLSGCPPRQKDFDFEMYASSASRQEVRDAVQFSNFLCLHVWFSLCLYVLILVLVCMCVCARARVYLIILLYNLFTFMVGKQSQFPVFHSLVTRALHLPPRILTCSTGHPTAVLLHSSTALGQFVYFILTTVGPSFSMLMRGMRAPFRGHVTGFGWLADVETMASFCMR
jgi:hypothetical protein